MIQEKEFDYVRNGIRTNPLLLGIELGCNFHCAKLKWWVLFVKHVCLNVKTITMFESFEEKERMTSVLIGHHHSCNLLQKVRGMPTGRSRFMSLSLLD